MTFRYASINVGKGSELGGVEEACGAGVRFVGADSGSNDVGPYMLANQGTMFPPENYRRDFRLLFPVTVAHRVPFVTGSAAGGGSDWGVDLFAGMVREAFAAAGLHGRMARIYAEVSPELVVEHQRAGRLRPLRDAPPYDRERILGSERIVQVLGPEPFQAVLEGGADVVIAGRASDTSIYAAMPAAAGVPWAQSYGAARIAECGAAAADPPGSGVLGFDVDEDGFTVYGFDGAGVTPASLGRQQLYEQADPFRRIEPGGVLDMEEVRYLPIGPSRVRVEGCRWEPADRYTLKLEGVEKAGYQSIALVSIADPVMLTDFDHWRKEMVEAVWERTRAVYGEGVDEQVTLTVRSYGYDGTLGPLTPRPAAPPSEVLLMATAVAADPELAHAHAANFWHTAVHHPSRRWKGFVNLAWPLSPPVVDRGELYRFNVHHAMEVDDPLDTCRIEWEDL